MLNVLVLFGTIFGIFPALLHHDFDDENHSSSCFSISLWGFTVIYWYVTSSVILLNLSILHQNMIGYALLGMICFGDVSEKFGDFPETLRTLFSVVNGDIIYDTFYSVSFAGLGGQVYLYLYTIIFTYGEQYNNTLILQYH